MYNATAILKILVNFEKRKYTFLASYRHIQTVKFKSKTFFFDCHLLFTPKSIVYDCNINVDKTTTVKI